MTGDLVQPLDRVRRGVAVGIARARRDDGNARSSGFEEWFGACSPRAVVGDLEQVDLGDAACEQLGVDPLLDIAREQEPVLVEFAQEHDRDVVDRRAAVGRAFRDAVRVGP